jgi:putative nucleotidyltransferase with HDIG domain
MEVQEYSTDYLQAFNAKSNSAQIELCSCNFEQMKQELLIVYDKKVERWLQAMDLYDNEITEHTLRVTALSLKLAQSLGFSRTDLAYVQYGTLLHDIGKLGIPEKIMRKPGKLTAYEYQVVKQHPLYAHEWLLSQKEYQPAKVIPLFHHERWDGGGYPYGLKGREIPVFARLVAVADVWDAITSDRPYRKAMSETEALELIHSQTGKQFDPEIIAAFLKQKIYKFCQANVLYPISG